MSSSQRSTVSLLFGGFLLLSGWAVAIGLGFRLWELGRPHPPETSAHEQENKFAPAFREFSSRPELAGAAVAFCLLDEKGQPLFASPLAGIALCPASSLKTATTGAAFAILGPEFHFVTVLAATTAVKSDGTLEGDLILVGGGDPTLSTEDLIKLADEAVAAGLNSVTGKVQVDASIYPENPVSDHWVWGDLGNAYGAGIYGVNLDHNRLALHFEPGSKVGEPAGLQEEPPVAKGTRWINKVTTGPAGSGDQVVAYSAPYGRTITLTGTVPLGESGFSVGAALPDPPALAAELLRAHLEAAGVKFADQTTSGSGERSVLARHSSDALPEIVDHLHRVSDNLEAQCLFLTIGRKLQSDPASAVQEHWKKAGVDFVGWRLLDGSGLARANAIRPLDLAAVNFTARHAAHGQRYLESLTAYLDGQVHGKVGSMSGVKTQVGFVKTAQNREFTYAVMGNGLSPGRTFWVELEKLLESVRTTPL